MRITVLSFSFSVLLAFSPCLFADELAGHVSGVEVAVPDSQALETALQGLSWQRFRFVVESVPKLKADVDAYGPLGWEFVRGNYRRYPWKRKIDRFDAGQRQHLQQLIHEAQARPE